MTISDIDRTPIYPTTEFNIEEKLTRISSIDLENGIELPKLPNSVGDRLFTNGRIERKVGKAVFDGSENWLKYTFDAEPYTTIAFALHFPEYAFNEVYQHTFYISNILEPGQVWNSDIANRIALIFNDHVTVRLSKSDLVEYGYDESMTDRLKVNVFKSWLSQNNIELYYQLA